MTNQEILETAIQKAIDGGWDMYGRKHFAIDPAGEWLFFYDNPNKGNRNALWKQSEGVIFNQDFAKALWGEANEPKLWIPYRQFHLQQMVIAPDPIKYLGEAMRG